MNKDLLDGITDIEVLKNGYRQLNKLVMIKENKLDQQQQEIERLNNIINELEELCKTKYYEKNTTDIDSIAIAGNLYVYMYKKIKELRGDKE